MYVQIWSVSMTMVIRADPSKPSYHSYVIRNKKVLM